MREKPDLGELDPAVDVRSCCKKKLFSFRFILHRDSNRTMTLGGSDVGTVHSGRGGEGPNNRPKAKFQ